VARTLSYTQAWVSEEGRNLKISAKKAVFLVSSGENKIHHFWLSLEKHLEKFTKSLSNTHAHKHVKLHHFCQNCVVLHHLVTLFNSTNAVSKP